MSSSGSLSLRLPDPALTVSTRILMILAVSGRCQSALGAEPQPDRAIGSFDRLGSTHVQPPPQHERSLP